MSERHLHRKWKIQHTTTASVFVQFCTKHTLKTAACATHTVSINNPNTHQPSLSATHMSQLLRAAKTMTACLLAVASTGVQRHKVPSVQRHPSGMQGLALQSDCLTHPSPSQDPAPSFSGLLCSVAALTTLRTSKGYLPLGESA